MAGLHFRITKDRVDEMIKKIPEEVGKAVAATALGIEATAKEHAPVDTGYLRNSIQAKARGPLEWEVNVGAEYGSFVNFGTRHMSPRPFFTRAVELGVTKFISDMRTLEQRIK